MTSLISRQLLRSALRSGRALGLRTSGWTATSSLHVSAAASIRTSSSRLDINASFWNQHHQQQQRSITTKPKPPPHAMLSLEKKVVAPPLVYIIGEEMTHYATELFVQQWFEPYFDLSQWERFDLSCRHRDETNDQVLKDAVAAGKRVGAIFKEPTITPSALQKQEMGLKNSLGSPNGAMRRGWNGITIS